MQATAAQPQPLLAPAVRVAVALPVLMALAAVVSIAAGASHQAIDHLTAELQQAPRRIQLEPVLVLARRDSAAAAAGCPRPEAG